MKTVLIGDIHGRQSWKQATYDHPDADMVVFIGDYFDSFHFKTEEQINNFLDIVEFKKTSGKEVIMLIGNHDHHYMVGDTGTSGYQQVGKYHIEPVIKENMEHLCMAYGFDNILCSHAGVGDIFFNRNIPEINQELTAEYVADAINDLFRFKPLEFIFDGLDCYGDDLEQTPIWIRPKSLMKGSKMLKKAGLIQVVGHTQQNKIDIKGYSTGGKYFFIDTLGTSGEYLIYNDGKFSTGCVK